jgi:acetoin utilization deacetylase AcuC-like enzyme
VELAAESCEGKLVSVLEGGYSLNFIGKIAALAIARMSGARYNVNDDTLTSSKGVRLQGEKVIKKVKKVLRPFWDISQQP